MDGQYGSQQINGSQGASHGGPTPAPPHRSSSVDITSTTPQGAFAPTLQPSQQRRIGTYPLPSQPQMGFPTNSNVNNPQEAGYLQAGGGYASNSRPQSRGGAGPDTAPGPRQYTSVEDFARFRDGGNNFSPQGTSGQQNHPCQLPGNAQQQPPQQLQQQPPTAYSGGPNFQPGPTPSQQYQVDGQQPPPAAQSPLSNWVHVTQYQADGQPSPPTAQQSPPSSWVVVTPPQRNQGYQPQQQFYQSDASGQPSRSPISQPQQQPRPGPGPPIQLGPTPGPHSQGQSQAMDLQPNRRARAVSQPTPPQVLGPPQTVTVAGYNPGPPQQQGQGPPGPPPSIQLPKRGPLQQPPSQISPPPPDQSQLRQQRIPTPPPPQERQHQTFAVQQPTHIPPHPGQQQQQQPQGYAEQPPRQIPAPPQEQQAQRFVVQQRIPTPPPPEEQHPQRFAVQQPIHIIPGPQQQQQHYVDPPPPPPQEQREQRFAVQKPIHIIPGPQQQQQHYVDPPRPPPPQEQREQRFVGQQPMQGPPPPQGQPHQPQQIFAEPLRYTQLPQGGPPPEQHQQSQPRPDFVVVQDREIRQDNSPSPPQALGQLPQPGLQFQPTGGYPFPPNQPQNHSTQAPVQQGAPHPSQSSGGTYIVPSRSPETTQTSSHDPRELSRQQNFPSQPQGNPAYAQPPPGGLFQLAHPINHPRQQEQGRPIQQDGPNDGGQSSNPLKRAAPPQGQQPQAPQPPPANRDGPREWHPQSSAPNQQPGPAVQMAISQGPIGAANQPSHTRPPQLSHIQVGMRNSDDDSDSPANSGPASPVDSRESHNPQAGNQQYTSITGREFQRSPSPPESARQVNPPNQLALPTQRPRASTQGQQTAFPNQQNAGQPAPPQGLSETRTAPNVYPPNHSFAPPAPQVPHPPYGNESFPPYTTYPVYHPEPNPPQAPVHNPVTFRPPQDNFQAPLQQRGLPEDSQFQGPNQGQVPRDLQRNTMDHYRLPDLHGRVPHAQPTRESTAPVHNIENWRHQNPYPQAPPVTQTTPQTVPFPQQLGYQDGPQRAQTTIPNFMLQNWAHPAYHFPTFDPTQAPPPSQYKAPAHGGSASSRSLQQGMPSPKNSSATLNSSGALNSGGMSNSDSLRGGYHPNQGPGSQGPASPPNSAPLSPQFPSSDEIEELIPRKTRADVLQEFHDLWDRKKNPPMKGGFGQVFKIRHFGRHQSALKIMSNEDQAKRELTLVRKHLIDDLNGQRKHPNIVQIMNAFEIEETKDHDSLLAIHMELCVDNLDQFLKMKRNNSDNLEATQVYCILIQILSGLVYCHERNFAHRDLKPANVLYTYDRCPQHPEDFELRFLLTDFGLSRPIGDDENGVTKEGFGTGGYRAPEVFDGKFGKRTDMFSFGCVMFDVASMGIQRAFTEDYEIRRYKDDYPSVKLRQLKTGWDTGLDNLTLKSFNRWIEECLHLDPNKRPKALALMKRMDRKLQEDPDA